MEKNLVLRKKTECFKRIADQALENKLIKKKAMKELNEALFDRAMSI
jgi:hypothetical protein